MSCPLPVVSVSVEMLILGWFLSHHYSETIQDTVWTWAETSDSCPLPVVSVSVEMLILGWFLSHHYSETIQDTVWTWAETSDSCPLPVVSVSVEMLILGWFLSDHYSETIQDTWWDCGYEPGLRHQGVAHYTWSLFLLKCWYWDGFCQIITLKQYKTLGEIVGMNLGGDINELPTTRGLCFCWNADIGMVSVRSLLWNNTRYLVRL